jgi:uncharacterized membrane protein YjjP (DUF1212 family)
VGETQERLTRIAEASGGHDARVVVLPTALMIAVGRAGWATIESTPQHATALRLDQVSALYELVGEAERGDVEASDGLRRLRAIHAMPPRYGAVVTIFAYAFMTVGLCLVLEPSPVDVAIAGAFGTLVGVIVYATRGRPMLTSIAPVLCATVVSALAFHAVKNGAADPGLRPLIAPLITFLPGAALTTATVEIASGEMVAGASRLVYGGVQLLLLAFGIVAGAELVGLPSEEVLRDNRTALLGSWAPWLGVLVFGFAVALHFSAPRGALRWLLVVLAAAWIGQIAGERLVGAQLSAFAGALVMTPVALAVARVPGAPPSQVTFLPAFWLLVPGAMGLIGVTEIVGNPASAGIEDLIKPFGSVVSIALGVLCGASIFRAFTARRSGADTGPNTLARMIAPPVD